jgi:hypothetical protein
LKLQAARRAHDDTPRRPITTSDIYRHDDGSADHVDDVVRRI